jgi:hypothetical protein
LANLRKFRRGVALLKKQGLLTGKVSNASKLDARSARPDTKVGGVKLSTLLDRYDDIISEKATAVTIKNKKKLREYKEAGFDVRGNKVIKPHAAGERVTKDRNENIKTISTSGIERIDIPVKFKNLKQYLTDIESNAAAIDRMKRRNEYIGFRFFGNNSSNLYSTIRHAIEDLMRYQTIQFVLGKSRIKQHQVYESVEFVRVPPRAAWSTPSDRRRAMSKKYNREHARKFRESLPDKPEHVQDEYLENQARRNREYRARLKKNKKKYSQYLKDGRKRAKKSSTKNKKKTKKKGNRKKTNRRR